MIIFKANIEIKTVFHKLIKTMGEDVKWTEVFVINNNDIILAGEIRSLFFNFDRRRAYSNVVELPIKEEGMETAKKSALLSNALNMLIYAFGKWGAIKGLKVDMNYEQLNRLLNNILEEIDIETILTRDKFHFYKDGVQITFEEVIQKILDLSKPEVEKEAEKESATEDIEEETEEIQEEETSKYGLGLWHNMSWCTGKFIFVKDEISESDRLKSRLGNDFYMVNYKCPTCKEKLYMVVYPMGKEFRIETDMEPVYMSRAYACSGCNSLYTPFPHKLLMEGDVFSICFEDDKVAYEDYLELLGREGQRTSNYNFNKFESEYNQIKQEAPTELEEICIDLSSMTESEVLELKDKMDSGFYPQESVEKYIEKVDKKLKSRTNRKNRENKNEENEESEENAEPVFTKKTETEPVERLTESKSENERKMKEEQYQRAEKEILKKEIVVPLLKGERDSFVGSVEKLSTNQMRDLKLLIQSEQGITESEKKNYIEKIDRLYYKEKEKQLIQKADACKEKPYAEILPFLDEIKDEDCKDDIKNPVIKSVIESLKARGDKELKNIITHIPENISRKQYIQLKEKIQQYKEIDNSPYQKKLDEKRDVVEKREIAAFVNRTNTTDRKSLFEVYNKLKMQDFEERNVKPYLDKIYEKIYSMDEAAIKKICPDPADITFEQGLKEYEKISSGMFLPELKVNVLGLIDKRLTKIKMDECEQLVKKLRKDMQPVLEKDSRIYFYDVRKMMKGDSDDLESRIIHNALNTYAVDRGKYEYPILICDTSVFSNGVAGFVLTPDHIFYNTLVSKEIIKVMDITNVSSATGLFGKGIYVNVKNLEAIKISNSLKLNKLVSFGKVLNEFVSYLKEKPESRNVSYLAKEKHKEKCCFRCGYVYRMGNVCPNCGSKFNE